MKVLDRSNIQIEIWERGAGYTLASGSSSCAAAAVARKLELCDAHVAVTMPGGILDIHICEDWSVSMTGPATKVCEGIIFDEIFNVKPGAGPSQAKYEMGGLAHGKDTSRRS
jgi:diaminopimelate epimerase